MSNEPRIVYKAARTVYAYGWQADLSGFRYGGCYSKPAKTKPLAVTDGVYQYDSYKLGVSMPNLTSATQDDPDNFMWVAVFAHAYPGDPAATIGFVPFLRVDTGVNNVVQDTANGTTAVRFRASEGTLIADAFVNTDVLTCQTGTNGTIANKIVKAVGNTTTTITLAGTGLGLAADNYILPAPPDGRDFQYLCSLKLRRQSSSPVSPAYGSWDSFTYSQRRAYVGPTSVGGDIASTTYGAVNFRHIVSPLATGVIGTLQAFWASGASPTSAYVYLANSDDSSDPQTAVLGTDRLVSSGDGGKVPFMVGFGATDSLAGPRQTLWAKVNDAVVTGRIQARGWVED